MADVGKRRGRPSLTKEKTERIALCVGHSLYEVIKEESEKAGHFNKSEIIRRVLELRFKNELATKLRGEAS